MRLVPALFLLSACMMSASERAAAPEKTHPAKTLERTTVPTRDGVGLDTTVVLPKGEGPFPVILFRYPYAMRIIMQPRCTFWAERGYACVHQFTRGQGRSGGAWRPFMRERDDGLDTLDWLREQPWQDGNWAIMGESYLAGVGWSVADEAPPEVKTMVLAVFGTDFYDALYANGLFRHEIASAWATLMPGRGTKIFAGGRYQKGLDVWPAREADLQMAGEELPWWRAWVDSPVRGEGFWATPFVEAISTVEQRVEIPVMMIGGWSDAFIGPQMDTWQHLATQSQSRFIVGPWNHVGRVASDVPMDGMDAGLGAQGFFQLGEVFDWVDHHLKGDPLEATRGEVSSYVAGGGRWEQLAAFPGETKPRRFYFADSGDDCGGRLSSTGSGTAKWTYDPLDPFEGQGGAGLLAGAIPIFPGIPTGFVDPGDGCARADVRGFRSDPLQEALHIRGSFTASLRVDVDVPDTSLVVRLIEERPDGKVVMVRDGFATLSAAGLIGGAGPVTVPITSWPIDWEFHEGSVVRVELTSSNFPKVARHPNRAEPWGGVVEPAIAQVEVELDTSWLELPEPL